MNEARSVVLGTFGDDSRYYTEANPYKAERKLGQKHDSSTEGEIRGLLDEYQKDARKRVERVYKQWNQIVRNHLRDETGLRLSVGEDVRSVPVRVVDGLPVPFANLVDSSRGTIFWLLILNRSLLENTFDGLEFTKTHLDLILDTLQMSPRPGAKPILSRSQDLVERLLKIVDQRELTERLKSINHDFLGAYFFRIPQVQLYWMVIGLVAGKINVSVDALALVVLIHELAHAYTHLGRDIDGERWDLNAFASAELPIVEGIAQFYTSVICEKLKERNPEAKIAFEALLEIQSECYSVHKDWASENERVGEVVRFTMIECRKQEIAYYSDFEETFLRAFPQLTRH